MIADKEEIYKRKKICDECPKKKILICMVCGCILEGKIRLKNEKCPINKW